ncbi:MAG: tetratricopeptide repeat protein [Xanthobacteraceae bacterium]
MAWRFRFGRTRGRPDPAALEQQVKALRAALDSCRTVAQRSGIRRALTAAGGVVLLTLGFVLGVNSDAIKQSMADRVPAGFADLVQPANAAFVAYEKGDQATALRRLRPLAEQGDPRAQSLLGLIYYTGRAGLRNEAEAVKWFRLAAGQGDVAAQFRLGLMYSEGQGVPQDHAEAAKWYQLAADSGYAQAQYNLGLAYAAGEGVPQDNVMAHMWLNLAVAQFPASDTRHRSSAVRSRDVVASKLTREQIAEAQKLAREWRPRAQQGSETS